ncbi:MAG: helix-turn-helix transcriptional regulator [Fibrobacteres bacterium]|nr:helix-turn-helix transcriptional regulator [Fibrobacterota bacterium]
MEILSRYGQWIKPGAGNVVRVASVVNPDTSIEFAKTELYRKIEARLTPGKWLKNLREANGYSQSELGVLIGDKKPVRPARVSDWESGFRAISKPVAKKLAAIFHVSADRFI